MLTASTSFFNEIPFWIEPITFDMPMDIHVDDTSDQEQNVIMKDSETYQTP